MLLKQTYTMAAPDRLPAWQGWQDKDSPPRMGETRIRYSKGRNNMKKQRIRYSKGQCNMNKPRIRHSNRRHNMEKLRILHSKR